MNDYILSWFKKSKERKCRNRQRVIYMEHVVSRPIGSCLHFLVLWKLMMFSCHCETRMRLLYLNRNVHINIFAHSQLQSSIISFAYILIYCLKYGRIHPKQTLWFYCCTSHECRTHVLTCSSVPSFLPFLIFPNLQRGCNGMTDC